MLAATGEFERQIVIDLLVILASTAVVAVLAQRVRLSVVPAYLVAGALIGPNALGLVPSAEGLGAISHLAIILLLFGIGLELHLGALRHGISRMLAAGVGSCALTVLIGWPVAMAFGLTAPAAGAVAMALSLSSTAVVLRIIARRRELRHVRGRLALAILVVQDLIVIAMLALVPVLAAWQDGRSASGILPADGNTGRFLIEALYRMVGLAVLVIAGKLVLPRLMRESLRGRSLEVMLIVGVAVALAAAVATHLMGFSLEMGAFLAGFLLAGTPFRHELAGQITPLRDLFMAVFFTVIGMQLDTAAIVVSWPVVVAGAALLMLVKTLAIGFACWSVGALGATAIAVGLALAQGGEFSLVLLEAGRNSGLVHGEVAPTAIAIVVLSLIVTPGLVAAGSRVASMASGVGTAPWIASRALAESGLPGAPDDRVDVVIAGFGPVGRRVAREADRNDLSYSVIELNPSTVERHVRQGRRFVFGDASRSSVLESAGIEHADVLVLAIPDEAAVARSCAAARSLRPDLHIIARQVSDAGRAQQQTDTPDLVVIDELATGDAMAQALASRFGGRRTIEAELVRETTESLSGVETT